MEPVVNADQHGWRIRPSGSSGWAYLRLFAFICGCIVLMSVGASAGTQKRPPVKAAEPALPRDVVVAPVPGGGSPYAESWAVIVGINDYRHPRVPKLRYAVNDARAVERTLRAQGFRQERILTLIDAQATKARIEGILGDELRTQVGSNDRVLVFFAGHGKTDRLRSGEEEGYLLPVDGDPGRLFSTAISMTALRQISDRIPAKHILYVVDACYSGYALFNRSISDDLYEEMVKKPAIQILTAGRQEDQAQERGGHGIFTEVLVRGLSGDAFPRPKAWLALEELGLWVKQRVFAESNKKQLPQYGNLSGEGQFVFLLPQGPGAGGQGPVARPPEVQPPVQPLPPPVVSIPPPTSPVTGDLDLTSEPSGATVRLDGREVGNTPLTLERLPVGEHTLELDKDGVYTGRRQITIAANTLDKLSLTLDRLKGKLTVFSDPRDATVFLDGKEVGRTPFSQEADAGSHTLRLTKEGYKPHEEALTLPANKETHTRIALRILRPGGTGGGVEVERPGGGAGGGSTLASYLTLVDWKIQSNWVPVPAAGTPGMAVVVRFRVLRSGQVRDLKVETGSGDTSVDTEALRAVQRSIPLPPFPNLLLDPYLDLRYRFVMDRG